MRYIIFILALGSFCVQANTDEETRQRLTRLYGESQSYERFFYDIKRALVDNDIEKVASFNFYPIRVNFDTETVYYHTQEQFIVQYHQIVTPQMLARIEEQTFAQLFANSNGMHFGFGDIWFSGYCAGEHPENKCDKVKVAVMAYNVNH